MERQLLLLDDDAADLQAGDEARGWRLDEETRRRGRAGVAAARAALAATRRSVAA